MMEGITFDKTTTSFKVLSGGSLIAEIERPTKTFFEQQIPKVLSWGELRNERATEILAQIDPQYAFWSSIVYMHPDRTRRTFELINLVLQFCVFVEMRFKHALGCYRPVEYNAQVQPMITTPGHGSFPMGHGTQAYAVAYVLKQLLKLDPGYPTVIEQLDRLVARITTNRVIAGVHFPVDSIAGRMLGVALGEYFVGRCLDGKQLQGRKFKAAGISGVTTEFNPFSSDQDVNSATSTFYSHSTGANIHKSKLMEHLWDKAQHEWRGRFGVA
jgi:hypothetical protein